MSQPRQFQIGQHNDTTFTKIFVGGLAWETQRHTMARYFEQFGEIIEAVVITDKNTGRSKGYGFVTFKDPEAAMRACLNPSPVIDGRRTNCNLASLGANKSRPPSTPHHGAGRFIPPTTGQYTFPISAYGYSGYLQDSLYPMSYYSVHGGQNFSPFYATGPGGGVVHNFYPFYTQFGQTSQSHGFRVQYPNPFQYPYLPHHLGSSSALSLPSTAISTPTTGGVVITEVSAGISSVTTTSGQDSTT